MTTQTPRQLQDLPGPPGWPLLGNLPQIEAARFHLQLGDWARQYGRVFKPSDELHGFSVDVVDMKDIAGPHHTHPNGEIDLIMPIDGDATFDERPAGWCVYGPGTAHRPTVARGRALVLYLLPQGAIEFTR